jgi:hypothetical protein
MRKRREFEDKDEQGERDEIIVQPGVFSWSDGQTDKQSRRVRPGVPDKRAEFEPCDLRDKETRYKKHS